LSAYSSTTIEGNPLPLTDVKRILKSRPANVRDSEREVLNYNNALEWLGEEIRMADKVLLSNDFICEVQKRVVKGLVPEYATGEYRKQPVFVNNPRTGETIYLPPDYQEVQNLMDDLLGFINSKQGSIDYLILAGIFHKQFVIIHPFLDGNGRTTRLVTKSLLAKMGLDTFQLFSFENYYNSNITKYFEKVGVQGNYYDEKDNWDFTEWLEYFTDGIIDELIRVSELLPRSTSLDDRLEEHHEKLLLLFEEKGVVKDSDYSKITDRSKASRVSDLQKLIDLGLVERKGKGRSTYYILK
jgi:Fic family protein